MADAETFLTALYVLADEFTQAQPPAPRRPGPAAALSQAEVLTLALLAQWGCFGSERAFYRYADAHLRPAFPRLPDRSQFNRLVRHARDAIAAFALHLAAGLGAARAPYEALDSTAARTRNAKRRGRGWLAGEADIGWSNRLGWYEGFHVLVSVTPSGVLTGFGFGPASSNDRQLADAFLAGRARPTPRLPSLGRPARGPYVADTGFAGRDCQARWAATAGAVVICPAPPDSGERARWPKPWRRWLAGVRQVVETVQGRLLTAFGLDRERPHAVDGFQARLAAKAALHNACIWLNRQAGRPDLALTGLLDW